MKTYKKRVTKTERKNFINIKTLVCLISLFILVFSATTYIKTYSDLIIDFDDDSDYVTSDVVGNKVYVNDLEADYYYYMGLNYTSNNGDLPTTENKKIYNENNLVQTKITYKGNDGTNKGYVSLSERQDTYVYFKMFEVNDNNTTDKSDDYVLIELIDNPFTDRPNDRGFNGWYTDYQNAKISYDNDYYERYVKVPITYKDDKPEKIDITMTAKWTTAKVSYVGSNFDNAIRSLNAIGMKKVEKIKTVYKEVDMTGYYYQVTLNRGASYNGLYDERGNRLGNGTCRPSWWGGSNTCTYYQRITNENFDENNTYYYLSNGYMTELDNSTIDREILSEEVNTDLIDANMSTYYQEVSLNYGESQIGYYNENGEATTGTCTSYYGCTDYKLLQYYNDNGEEEIFDINKDYYYLVTRDTNILVLNNTMSGTWSDNGDYPFTMTSLHNGTKYNVTWNANSAINCYNDTNIENVTLYYGTRISRAEEPSASTSGTLYGNYHNVKLGRGLTQNGSYPTLRSVVAGNNSNAGSNNNPEMYKFILESGIYNSVSLSTVSSGSSNNYGVTVYIKNKSIYGNDYDRVKKNNDNLDIYFCASGSWSGYIYASTNTKTTNDVSMDLIVKSGTFGSARQINNGIYVGGRGWSAHYSVKKIKVEGGSIYNLVGGPSSDTSRKNSNDIYIYMTGGEVDLIVGGATVNETYGNRIIVLTGGKVNYSVFGGSNGYTGTSGSGTLDGTAYIYAGGTVEIGDKDLIDNSTTLFGAEAGSIFGNGNGNSSDETIGSCNNSIVIIDGKATINNNVYGGGNYGATGVSSNSNTSYTKIIINDGFIEGSVYGGGNKNGSGSLSKTSTIYITMNKGNVVGSVYGGSNEKGTIYGTVNININGGEITNSVYGGGRGGYTNTSNSGTFVRDNINVVVGDSSINTTPIINKNVYGGSAYGTVNGTTGDNNISSNQTSVIINKGIITNVYGGGEGNDTYVPYVKGNIIVDINGGVITNVYGGNDQNGTPNGNILVNINNGEIANTYGGGNKTSAKTTNVNLNGGTSTNIYGGSNELGDVNVSNIITNGGTATNIYGGNNIGGITDVTNVTINDGNIDTVYGGGNETSIGTSTNVNLNGKVNNLFGGSNLTGSVPLTNVNVNMGTANNVYGGNDAGGKTNTSNIVINGCLIENVFGGGLEAETSETNVNLNYGRITNIYGGGDEASAQVTNINLSTGNVTNIYGGSNTSGEVSSSNISNSASTNNSGISVNSTFTKGQLNTWENMGSSVTLSTTINNKTGFNITKWDLYLITTKSEFDSNWSDAKVDVKNDMFHINEIDNYWGTNEIANGSSYSFSFNIQSYLSFDEFAIYGYMIKGYDNNGNVYISNGFDKMIADYVYGGNNAGGVTDNSNINLTAGEYNYIFGGGKKAVAGNTKVSLDGIVVNKAIYGGGDAAAVNDISLIVNNTIVGNDNEKANVYGGGNDAKVDGTITTTIDNFTEIYGNFYSGGNKGEVIDIITTNINNSYISDNIFGGGNKAFVGNGTTDIVSNLNVNSSTTCNVYGGGSAASVLGSTNLKLNNANITCNVYGGGDGTTSIVSGDETGEANPAKVSGNTNLNIDGNTNITESVFGGGNLGMIEGNTNVTIKDATINESIYGGGNAAVVGGNTNLLISGPKVLESVYAGGNGTIAIVKGNTNLNIDNSTTINKHVFGGGNAAATGVKEKNTSTGMVNIVGATIGGNVYGGANTSVLYGETTVNIGSSVLNNELIKSNISIDGTVFGGGEANASGSENYDYSFISITKGIKINIDGSNYDVFDINGSIFGSGNASSTTGYSYINIKNYGTSNDIKKNVSIQRADVVTLDNTYILLSGATDRTNEYSSVLFTFSRIDELKLINSSSIYLEKGANLLKKISSLALIDGKEVKATADIDNEKNTFNRNVNNRIYMFEGENLNVATNEAVTTYGEVSGMTFFGMYLKDRNGKPVTALYSDYNYGQKASSGDIYYFTSGSYVLGRHNNSHDITKDGFYSNYASDDDSNTIIIRYIEPTPEDSNFYMWVIGESVVSYDVSLTASKYSTLGTYELSLLNYAKENTTFSVLGVNFNNLEEGIRLIPYGDIPRIASSAEEANSVFGLSMKSGQNLITKGTTSFITVGDKDIIGTTSYIGENTSAVPSFTFYLYHSKNLSETGNIGTVTISLVAITPIDDLNNEVERLNINVDLSKALYNTNDYEGTITPGEEYEMFATSTVNITSRSSFSTYYSLFMNSDTSPYKDGYHRALVSTYAFPINTKITMIDFAEENKPVYYYYVVNEVDYNTSLSEFDKYGEVSYKLSKFIKMGSISDNNNYDDVLANSLYYKDKIAQEEFIFIVNFEDSNIFENQTDKKLLIELRNNEEQTLISVLGIEQETLKYNLYTNSKAIIDLDANLSKNPVYIGGTTNLTVNTNFIQNKIYSDTIYDTSYNNQKLGIKISIYDENDNLLNASSLMGINFAYNGNIYYPRNDGTIRINLAERIANVSSKIIINTENSTLSTGKYKLVIESFGSPDGIYYGLTSSDKLELDLNIIDTIYGLSVDMKDSMIIIDKTSGLNKNKNNNLIFDLNYSSELENPNVRVKLYRRNYDAIYTDVYDGVDLKNYITNDLVSIENNFEYILTDNPVDKATYFWYLKDNLVSGTYKIVYSLYDNNNFIGDIYKYIVIK